MGKGKKVTIGYRYRLGFHLILCQGGADAITKIRYEDRDAWTGNVTGNTTVTINKPDLFGGDKKQGGLQGNIDFMFGADTQPVNSYLSFHCNRAIAPAYVNPFLTQGGADYWGSTLVDTANNTMTANGGTPVPAYRGVVSLLFKNFMYGAMNPYMKPFRVTVRRIPTTLGATNSSITIDGIQHANPAHIIYDVLTNKQWGQGLETGDIDIASFTTAAATLASEGFGVSFKWAEEGTAESFINMVLAHCAGTLFPDPATGKYTLKLMRNDYVVANLTTLDESNIINMRSYQRMSNNDLTNEITIQYYDPINEKDAKLTVQNLASIRSVGRVVRRVIEYPGIRSQTLAARVAQRDLLAFSTPLAKLTLEVNLTAWNLRPGDCFKFSWAKLGIVSGVYRIIEIEYGALRDNKIVINAIEDIYALPSASYVGTQPPLWSEVTADLQDITTYKFFDAPYWNLIQYFGEDYAATLADNRNYFAAVVPRANGLWTDFLLYENVSGTYTERESAQFSPFVSMTADIAQLDTSATYSGFYDLDLVTLPALGVIDNEWVWVTAINTTTKTLTLTRGVLDSVPAAHLAGALLYIYGTEDYVLDESDTRFAAEGLTYKMLPRSTSGVLELANATARAYTVNGRQQRPYPPGNVTLNTTYFPTSVTDDVVVAWAHRDRTVQTATPIGWTSGNVGPEAGVTYTLTFYRGATATVVYTITGQTGTSFTATEAQIGEEDDLRLEIKSVRSSIDNFQTFSHRFSRDTTKDEYVQRVRVDSPLGFWRLGDATGSTTAADSSGNARTGTVSGATFQSTAVTYPAARNKAATFDGSNDYISVPYVAALAPTAAVTVETWVNFTSLVDAGVVSKTQNGGYAIRIETIAGVAGGAKSLHFLAWRGAYTYAGYAISNLQTGVPYHLVGTYDGRYARLYIDGAQVDVSDNVTTANISYANNNALIIGAEASTGSTPAAGEYLPGTLDEVSVYGTAIDADRVLARYRSGTGRISYREDAFWDKVTLSLHMNGTNGSTTFTDAKGATTWTAAGNAQISTTQSKFGGASAYFDGTGDYVTTPYVPATMDWATGDFTLEAWVYPISLTNWGLSTNYSRMIGRMDATSSTNVWSFGPTATGNVVFYYWVGSQRQVVSTTTISTNVWTHIAVVVTGGTNISIYINGVKSGTGVRTEALATQTANFLTLGQYANTCINGYVDDLRMTRAARYTRDFIIPVEAFPDRQCLPDSQDPFWADKTVLLMHMNGTNGSTTFTDVKGNSVTALGNAQVTTAQSKFGGASALFDGTGDYLSIPHSSTFDFGSEDFTLEAWYYPQSVATGFDTILVKRASNSNFSPFFLYRENATLRFDVSTNGSSWISIVGGTLAANTWYHIAAIRHTTSLKLYLNGALVASGTVSGALMTNASEVLIGSDTNSNGTQGYIDEVRITRAARYLREFAPPKAAFPDNGPTQTLTGSGAFASQVATVTGTATKTTVAYASGAPAAQSATVSGQAGVGNIVLLSHLDGTNGSTTFTDVMGHAMTAVGNAQVSTAQSKFGGASAIFDGSGDYVTVAGGADFDLGTITSSTAFTVEMWARVSTFGSAPTLVAHALPGSGGNGIGGWAVRASGGKIQVTVSKNSSAANPWYFLLETNAVVLTGSTWHHVAVVFNAGFPAIYVDGTLRASTVQTPTAIYATTPVGFDTTKTTYGLAIGGTEADSGNAASSFLNGYVDEVRVVRGAMYTGNFTPTGPFT